MLRDQPIPHRLVVVLVHHALPVGTERHDHRDRGVGLRPIDVGAQDEPIVHRDLQVSFNLHVGGCVAR